MNKTKIEWCDMTWNPVTGCLHNCEYCYAGKISDRFQINDVGKHINIPFISEWEKYSIGDKIYSRYFQPRFHSARLDEPQKHKKPQNVFVCSMADLFGEWIPDEWIQEVFKACEAAPQHRYLFLSKNPLRYATLSKVQKLPCKDNFWYGTTITNDDTVYYRSVPRNVFVNIEPIQTNIRADKDLTAISWVIIGAETGNHKGKVIPKREWIENIVENCRNVGVPVFLKDNLASVWGEPLIQEFPWKERNNGKD